MTYLLWVAAEDEETQKKGTVVIIWPSEDAARNFFKMPDQTRGREFQRSKDSSPVRCVASHVCLPDTHLFRTFKGFLMFWLGSHRTRTRFYTGMFEKKRPVKTPLSLC